MSASPPPLCEALARRLAAQAGLPWDSLHQHPGYLRQLFRERADALLAELIRHDPPPPGGGGAAGDGGGGQQRS